MACHFPGVLNRSADALSHKTLQLFFHLNSQASPVPVIIPPELRELVLNRELSWTSPHWMAVWSNCWKESSIAPATLKAYKPAQQRYSSFCMKYNIQPLFPLQEDILCRYVTFLAQQHLKYCTIKAYLSGIRCLQIQLDLGNPFGNGVMPCLTFQRNPQVTPTRLSLRELPLRTHLLELG